MCVCVHKPLAVSSILVITLIKANPYHGRGRMQALNVVIFSSKGRDVAGNRAILLGFLVFYKRGSIPGINT